MSVIFLFIDGVGVGLNTPHNPLVGKKWQSFSWFTGKDGLHQDCDEICTDSKLYKPIDANLDTPGLPQSGTGQTSLFSGINASKIAGRHYGPYPYTKTRYLLEEKSLFHQVISKGKTPCFINAYPDLFFKKAKDKNRWTSTTMMAKSAGTHLNGEQDVKDGKAVTAEIIQDTWRNVLKIDIPEITIDQAAQRILDAAARCELVLYEYYLTDKAGHKKDWKYTGEIQNLLDPFILYIIQNISADDTLVITSDHGNLEDLSRKTHTRNPVPLFVIGDIEEFKNAKSILDVTPAIVNTLG